MKKSSLAHSFLSRAILSHPLSAVTLAACLAMTGCAHVNSVSLTSIPAQKGKTVRAETSRTIVLGFNFDNDYVDEVAEDLRRQCPNGVIRGILTKDETINYFLFFVWARKITASGSCLQARNTAGVDETSSRTPASESENGPTIQGQE